MVETNRSVLEWYRPDIITVIICAFLAAGPATLSLWPHLAAAQTRATNADGEPSEGPQRRAALRVLTESDYPPFHYTDEDGTLTGLNVELAKAVCLELAATCDVQVKPWGDLLALIKRGEADAVIASHSVTPGLLRDVAVSDRYYYTPGRFVGHKDAQLAESNMTPSGLARRKIAVAKGTAHEAYLKAFFRDSEVRVFDNVELARDAVRNKTTDLLFDDGISLVFWLNGEGSKLCCEFKGGPFTEQLYFGDGVGILLRKSDELLKTQVNGALKRLRESGRIEELMLRYFPIRPY
jgi:polar amino acid transport system substrate-binding protein